MTSRIRSTVLLTAMLVVAASAQASLITYYGLRDTGIGAPSDAPLVARNTFLANVINPGTETFSSFIFSTPRDPLPIVFAGNGRTGSISGPNFFVQNNAGGNPGGRYDTTGAGDRYIDADDNLTVTFTIPTNVFGFYGTDIGDFANAGVALYVLLTDVNDVATNLVVQLAGTANGSLLFWGFIDDGIAYKSVRLSVPISDFIGLDDMIVGSLPRVQPPGVPEPASLALGGVALLALAAIRRRRR